MEARDLSPAGQKRIHTIVIGGGQAGLAAGYHLAQSDVPFLILDGSDRVGDAWRRRWDSLRLFTPARWCALPGMPFPGDPHAYPTKDEMADYLTAYRDRFELPVRSNAWVRRVARDGEDYLVETDHEVLRARNVVVAMSNYQKPWTPPFADRLSPEIFQVHSADYRNPDGMRDGDVLVVGAANSGTEIALELAASRETLLAGRPVATIPFRIEGFIGRQIGVPFVIGFLFHHLLTTRTPVGRSLKPKFLSMGGTVVRVKPRDLARAGVRRGPKVAGVRDGLPELEDGRVLDVRNVVWATGYKPDFSWIDVPVFEEGAKEPRHDRGVVEEAPGLYFIGLFFLYAASSGIFRGVGRDASYVVEHLRARAACEIRRRSPRSREAAYTEGTSTEQPQGGALRET